jgi:hypothetical protein
MAEETSIKLEAVSGAIGPSICTAYTRSQVKTLIV